MYYYISNFFYKVTNIELAINNTLGVITLLQLV